MPLQTYRPKRREREIPIRKKQCIFCKKKIEDIDYKDSATLQRFLTSWGKIREGRETGTCSRHQRYLTRAIKRARYLALLPYTSR